MSEPIGIGKFRPRVLQSRGILIGLGGWQESGKDALADFLVEDFGYAKTFFSEALNEAVIALHPDGGPWVRLDHPEDVRYRDGYPETVKAGGFIRYAELVKQVGYTRAKTHRDVREYLRGLGTDVGRNMFGENVWTDIIEQKIRTAWTAGKPVVVTGIRYPNELQLFRDLGGVAAWVKRPGIVLDPAHTSETSLSEDDFDFSIDNDSDLVALRETAAWLHDGMVEGETL